MLPWLDLYEEGVLAPHNISSPFEVMVPMEHEIPKGSEMSSPPRSSWCPHKPAHSSLCAPAAWQDLAF